VVWVLDAYRAGERTQIMALAEALSADLGWNVTVKQVIHNRFDFVPGLLRRASLAGIHRDRSSPLAPPWPDIVISAGMRNEPVARWIRAESGGRTRLVWVGRPWAPLEVFDLVITTPQYRLPVRDNVLQNVGTLHRITPERLAAEAAAWAPEFGHLPRPVVGVVAGGHSGPLTFGPAAARRLGEIATAAAGDGSVIATTSPRTAADAGDALAAALTGTHYLFKWSAAATRNPYLAILGTADRFIVTSDTVSMLTETVATGKPVEIFDLDAGGDSRFTARIYKGLMRFGPQRATRDLTLFHEAVLRHGRCRWAGRETPDRAGKPAADMERATARVAGLLERN
jgi:mitochondrial fission protein ELM1